MKHLTLALMGLAALSLASCSSDEPAPVANNGDGVTFTVQLPGDMAPSRAFSDGFSALNLTAAAYDAQGNFVTSNTATFDGKTLTTTISLDLVNGYDYDVVFWAQNSAANTAYTVDLPTGKLAVDYSKVTPNSDNFDCFYTVVKNLGISANMPAQNVTLNRPMAQINVGTSDLSKESVKKAFMTNGTWNLNTSIKASVYNGMNLLTGAVEGTAAAYTFENIPLIAANTETFPVSGYEYMAMVYVLQSPTKLTEQGVVTFNNGTTKVSEIEIPNLPLQRNYRTNIYGQLLTSTTNFTVTIDPIYETPDHNLSMTPWDGKTKNAPVVDDAAKTITMFDPTQVAGLEDYLAANPTKSTYTFIIGADMDFNNFPITIFNSTRSGTSFSGTPLTDATFDGQNHILANIKITTHPTNSDVAVAFIGAAVNSTIKDIQLKNVNITSPEDELCGGIVGGIKNSTVSNCHVLSGTIEGNGGTGGITGRMIEEGVITGCSNAATISSTAKNPSKVGGIVGIAYYPNGKVMKVENCTNKGAVNGYGNVGGIVGRGSGCSVANCTNTAAITTAPGSIIYANPATGGIIGYNQAFYGASVKGCVNAGNVTGHYFTGGIVGETDYQSAGAGQNLIIMEISGNTNWGSVTGTSTIAGGIIGNSAQPAIVNDNNNYALAISATNECAGICANFGPLNNPSMSNVITCQNNTTSTPLSDITATTGTAVNVFYLPTTSTHMVFDSANNTQVSRPTPPQF